LPTQISNGIQFDKSSLFHFTIKPLLRGKLNRPPDSQKISCPFGKWSAYNLLGVSARRPKATAERPTTGSVWAKENSPVAFPANGEWEAD